MPSVIDLSNATLVSQNSDGSQNGPTVATLSDGSYVVVWYGISPLDSSRYGVFGRLFDGSGEAIGSDFRINQIEANEQRKSDVTALDGGGFMVGWDGYLTDFPDGNYDVIGRFFDNDGTAVTDDFFISGPGDNNAVKEGEIALTTMADGRVLAAYEISENLTDVVYRTIDLNAQDQIVLTPETDAADNDPGQQAGPQRVPQAITLSGGGTLIAWRDLDGSNAVFARFFDEDGVAQGKDFQINLGVEGSNLFSVAALDGGGFVAVYNGDSGLHMQRFDGDGDKIGARFDLENPSDDAAPAILSLPDGGFLVAYNSAGLALQRFDADGQPVGDLQKGFGDLQSVSAQIDMDLLNGGRTAIVTWQTDGGNQSDVAQQQFAIVDIQTGTKSADTLTGTGWFDELHGKRGADTLLGRGGQDWLDGGNGRDLLKGGKGDDTLTGGKHNDTLLGQNGSDDLLGNGGKDVLKGAKGNDTLNGQAGDDTLLGGDGRDMLRGGGGNDILNGGRHNDILNGGGGEDIFVFSKGKDRVQDFVLADDVVDLTGVGSIASFQDLVQNHMEQVGNYVQITSAAGDRMILNNTDIADLGSDNFLF